MIIDCRDKLTEFVSRVRHCYDCYYVMHDLRQMCYCKTAAVGAGAAIVHCWAERCCSASLRDSNGTIVDCEVVGSNTTMMTTTRDHVPRHNSTATTTTTATTVEAGDDPSVDHGRAHARSAIATAAFEIRAPTSSAPPTRTQ